VFAEQALGAFEGFALAVGHAGGCCSDVGAGLFAGGAPGGLVGAEIEGDAAADMVGELGPAAGAEALPAGAGSAAAGDVAELVAFQENTPFSAFAAMLASAKAGGTRQSHQQARSARWERCEW
jgi:hypothetical protein